MADSCRIRVYVQPRASKTAVVGMHGDSIRIRLTAPPVDNAANEALVEFVAGELGIAKQRVRIVSGQSSRRKLMEIDGVTAEAANAALLARSEPRKGD